MNIKKICDSSNDWEGNAAKLNELLAWLSQDDLDEYLAYFNQSYGTDYPSFEDIALVSGEEFVLNELEIMMSTDQWNEFEKDYERVVLNN